MNRRKIHLITPTRDNPNKMRAMYDSLCRAVDDHTSVIVWFGVDNEDSQSISVAHELKRKGPVKVEVARGSGGCQRYWHTLSLTCTEYKDDLVILSADDLHFERSKDGRGADTVMLENTENENGPWLYFGEDGIQGDGLATHPFFTFRTIKAMGGLATGITSVYNDTWMWGLFHLFEEPRVKYIRDLRTTHKWHGPNPRHESDRQASYDQVNSIGSRLMSESLNGLMSLFPEGQKPALRDPQFGHHGLRIKIINNKHPYQVEVAIK